MREQCPRCGAERLESYRAGHHRAWYDCHSIRLSTGGFEESQRCLRNQLDQAKKLYREAVASSHNAYGPVANLIGVKPGESWTNDAPRRAVAWIERAQGRIAELERQIAMAEHPDPNGLLHYPWEVGDDGD